MMTTIQDDRYPRPPVGYQSAVLFQYPKIKLQIAALVVLAVITPLILFLTWMLQHPSVDRPFVTVNSVTDLLPAIVTALSITTIHELVHGLTYQLLGYQVSYGVSVHLFAAYAAAFRQWQARNHNLVVALAPLVILTGLFLPMLAIQNRVVVLVAVTALMMNTAGAVGDMYLCWRLLRMPCTTLLYDMDIKTMLVYKPEIEGQKEPI
ncbi:MAG: DUF3267 domain-containing protein [Chloroflexi bacterium]|nr:DUF3267 domain-containing protein [Chloroflexota bacterium]